LGFSKVKAVIIKLPFTAAFYLKKSTKQQFFWVFTNGVSRLIKAEPVQSRVQEKVISLLNRPIIVLQINGCRTGVESPRLSVAL